MTKVIPQHSLGQTLAVPSPAERGTVHLAVIPVRSDGVVYPGQHVGFLDEEAATRGRVSPSASTLIGIVDPFLALPVYPGSDFWLVLYPDTVPRESYTWSHPAFDAIDASKHAAAISEAAGSIFGKGAIITETPKTVGYGTTLNKVPPQAGWDWMMDFSKGIGVDLETLMSVAREHLQNGHTMEVKTSWPGVFKVGITAEFWDAFHKMTGILPSPTPRLPLSIRLADAS